MKSQSPVGLVSRQWDAVDWTCVLFDRRIHNGPSEQISFIATMRLTVIQLSCRLFFFKASHHPGLPVPLQTRFGSLLLLAFPKVTIVVEREEICECDGHTLHKLSQRHLTADWLASRGSNCSRIRSKVSSDWLPSYIKATRPVLEIFKLVGYFLDSPRILLTNQLTIDFNF